jgi:hypothetical protein
MNASRNKPITRKGKIARLPYEIREQINALIRDGAPASRLNTYLIKNGHEAVNDTNWTNWRKGGYLDWLREQAHLDTVRAEYEEVRRQIDAGGFSILDKAILDVVLDLKSSGLTPDKVASAIAALKTVVTADKRADTYERRAQLAEKALTLQQHKFERETCKLFLKWHTNQKAREIAEGKATNTVKVDQLRQLIFGRPPDASAVD